jgi:hypothetical protein
VMGAFHRWWSWESGAHGHAYLNGSTKFLESMLSLISFGRPA